MTRSQSGRRLQTARLSRRGLIGTLAAAAGGIAAPAAAERLPGAIVLAPDSPSYSTYARGYNARITARPAAIALCRNEEGIANALAYAKRNNWSVAVKSGGHSFEGFSLNNDGLVIDLSQMRSRQTSGNGTVVCGPGWQLGGLYDALIPTGRFLPAGSCGSVGIGGLTLGGGYGLFARQFGLTCDHLTGVRLVSATGRVLDSDNRPDLLRACRGGGNGNFGVVSEMRFRLAPAPASLTAHRFKARRLDAARAVALLRSWMMLEPQLPTTAFSAFVLNGSTLTILVTTTGPDAPLEPVLQQLAASCDESRRGRPRSLLSAIQPFYGRRGPLAFKNASGGFYRAFADLQVVAGALVERAMATPGVIFQVNTLGGAIANEPDAVGSAYFHRGSRFLAELQAYWERDSQAAARIGAIADMQALIGRVPAVGHYRNYPDLNLANWATAYYGNALPQLQALKRELDPENRIRHPQSVR